MTRVLVYASLDSLEAVVKKENAISEDFDQTARVCKLI